MKSGMLEEHFITFKIIHHYIAIWDFIENLRLGRNMKDLVQNLHNFSSYKI